MNKFLTTATFTLTLSFFAKGLFGMDVNGVTYSVQLTEEDLSELLNSGTIPQIEDYTLSETTRNCLNQSVSSLLFITGHKPLSLVGYNGGTVIQLIGFNGKNKIPGLLCDVKKEDSDKSNQYQRTIYMF